MARAAVQRAPEIEPNNPYQVWFELVRRIESGETGGMEELYALFCHGIRFYMLRHLQPQDIEDKLHDTFLIVVQAIRRGDIREPMRLMGYTRTVVRRLVALHIEQRVEERRDLNSSEYKGYEQRDNPEETVFFRQRNQILEQVLQELSDRDREILTRFYIREQGSEQICEEMALSETQFRLLKTRAKNRFGELGRKKLAQRETGRTSGRAAAASA